jgi:hypothetical protein
VWKETPELLITLIFINPSKTSTLLVICDDIGTSRIRESKKGKVVPVLN